MHQTVHGGLAEAGEELLPLVHQELRTMAARMMAREAPGDTLQPTVLVREAWLEFVDAEHRSWQNRAHFFGAAAEAMRRILIMSARRKHALRRGGGAERVDLDKVEIAAPISTDQWLAVNEALDRFAAPEPRQAQLVKLRFFVGLAIEEAAQVLGISEATAKRWWVYARAWLFEAIQADRP